MLRSSRQSGRTGAHQGNRPVQPAPLRRPGGRTQGTADRGAAPRSSNTHPLCHEEDNRRLFAYERDVKDAFDRIVPTLKQVSALQHEADFEGRAQDIARREFGFELPAEILADAWIDQLDMRRLYAWCTFQTYRRFCNEFFTQDPLAADDAQYFDDQDFEGFLQTCGFHTLDITPCSDGRLAHLISYVLRLPHHAVRRKSYAGALFSIEDSLQKWQEVELSRYREGRPNPADAPTRYLKMVAYHFSSVDPAHEGCAAHGSDDARAAGAGRDQLYGFREAIENSFCCGASIDLLLIGLDTDTDSLRVHVPDADGGLSTDRYLDTLDLYSATAASGAERARHAIHDAVRTCSPGVAEGMVLLIERLIENNFSQIAYVRTFYGSHYQDIGHAERFIGAGVGFEEKQLRNLMFFAYLDTVEEATQDLDVGIKIFSGLNVHRGLPVPIVVRFDYHAQVPGARARAAQRCERVTSAIKARYADLFEHGLLHVMQVVRDCTSDDAPIEVLGDTVNPDPADSLRTGDL